MDEHSQYKTALGLAKRALEYIASYRTPPTPHAYEIFYTVCVGQNAQLNKAVAKRVSETQTISAEDLEELYEKYISSTKSTEEMQSIGTKMNAEMSALLTLLATASNSANSYQASLQNAQERLDDTPDPHNVSELIKTLRAATEEMSRTNAEVSSNLETSRAQVEQLEDCLKLVREESSRDSLTGLVNRKQFDLILDETLIKSDSTGQPACLLMIDVDDFKEFNDTHGHVAGDSALRYVASCVKSSIKGQDTAARYGGEEIAVVLPNTALEYGVSLAERIRHLVNSRHLVKKATGESMGRISVSVGVTQAVHGDGSDSIVIRADQAMYHAKKMGKNRVYGAPHEAPEAETEEEPKVASGAA